jgi:fimbrial chaperone protein
MIVKCRKSAVSLVRLVLAMAMALQHWAACAATFGLSPMRVELSGSTPAAVLTVTNGGDEPVTVQLQARSWRQIDGQDTHEPTSDLILNPVLATIAPNSEQIVRIALRTAPDRTRERAYRLLVREVPITETGVPGVRMALAMDIPVYVAPVEKDALARPTFTLERTSASGLRVRIANEGEQHLRLAGLEISQGRKILVEQGVFIVLPGAVRHIVVPADSKLSREPLKLKAQTNAGPIEAILETNTGR